MWSTMTQSSINRPGIESRAQERGRGSKPTKRILTGLMGRDLAKRLNLEVPVSWEKKLQTCVPSAADSTVSTSWSTLCCQALGCLEMWSVCRPGRGMMIKSKLQWELDNRRPWFPAVWRTGEDMHRCCRYSRLSCPDIPPPFSGLYPQIEWYGEALLRPTRGLMEWGAS